MYSRKERMKAVELYIKYDKSASDTIQELGYPDRHTLKTWYRDYLEEQETGIIHEKYIKASKYTEEQQERAVRYYLEHGRCYSRTVRILGYPNRETLRQWCHEKAPDKCRKRRGSIKYTHEQKEKDEKSICSMDNPVKDIVQEQEVKKLSLLEWKDILPCEEAIVDMSKEDKGQLQKTKEELLIEVEDLQKQIRKLKLERDVLEKTAEIIKKDPGVDPKNLTNREKAILVDAVRDRHPLQDIIDHVAIKRSSYFYQRTCLLGKDQYHKIRDRISELFHANSKRYGYRRIHALLASEGIRVSEKTVRQIMKEDSLIVLSKKKRKYSSYQGEKAPSAPNLIARDFHADTPNIKWLTDITEFQIPAGKIYLSPIVDCFDGMIVSWTIGTSPNADLVNTMLDEAIKTLKPEEHPIVHSDRGAHYRWPGWLKLMKDRYLIRSMSRKGCSPDNSACEGVFGRIKNEMFYNRNWSGVSVEEFIKMLDEYMYWYNETRIKMSLGALSPMDYRKSLSLAA